MNNGFDDRQYWLSIMLKISKPVLEALSNRNLKASMPVESTCKIQDRREHCSHLEATARTLTGIAPWLESETPDINEKTLRKEFCRLARASLDSLTDEASPDYVDFSEGYQPLVESGFLSHAILRAPKELWTKLENHVKENIIRSLKATRSIKPYFNNWLLFSAIIETALYKTGQDWDPMRVDYALRQHEAWYKGDGTYGDGPEFHWDYYNSFVIQPMLVDIINTLGDEYPEWSRLKPEIIKRAVRFAEIQERLISPDGTFPPIGRSLAYRFGVFQHLSQMSLQHKLPEGIHPAQARSALTAVIKRTMSVPGNFDESGWLKVGFCGSQLEVGENYISTGSLYLCMAVFAALGLPPEDLFWSGKSREWTQKAMWFGKAAKSDHALHS